MPNEELIKQISQWHPERKHDQIIESILSVPEGERSDELICLYAQALNNREHYHKALAVLDGIARRYAGDPYYCIRYAIALYELNREDEAVRWFKQAQDKGLEEINEMPDTYLPKSVKKWVERAELWGPRRAEKNAFEAEQRAKRKSNDLPAADSGNINDEGLWDDCDYSLKNYVGDIPTDDDICKIETELGYRLPDSYKALVKRHNGGLLAREYFKNPMQCGWQSRVFHTASIYGLDREKRYSLCGAAGSRFRIEEWGYPDIGIAIGDTMTGGHDMIFLDYSDCGPEGEPCVVHINQESNYEITYLADDFKSFVDGLFAGDVSEGEEE